MTEYSAPVADMLFTLERVVGVQGLADLPDFAEVGLEALPDVLAEASRFFGEVVSPTNRAGDTQGSRRNDDGSITTPDGFAEAYQAYVDGGWGAMSFEPEFGGGGFPWVVGLAVQEMMTAANMAFSLNPMLTQGSIHALSAHGGEEQKLRWLPKLISGEWTGTMNLTEPQAGSDVGALTAKAVRQDDGSYLISGQKIYITWGEHDLTDNIVHLVLARTPDAPPGTRGISLFIVPKFLVNADGSLGERNDIECVSIEHKMGIHASPTCVLQFGDNGGAVGEIIGDEQSGMRSMFTMMNQARLAVGLEGLAVADRSYQQALEYALERQQGRRADTPKGESVAIIEHPDVRRMLMTMKSQIEALRCLVYLNAWAVDVAAHHPDEDEARRGQELCDLLTPLSKAWGTDLGNELTSLGVQIHGGMGYVEETGAAQHYRDIRIAAIYEGTNGIQAIDLVGRKLADARRRGRRRDDRRDGQDRRRAARGRAERDRRPARDRSSRPPGGEPMAARQGSRRHRRRAGGGHALSAHVRHDGRRVAAGAVRDRGTPAARRHRRCRRSRCRPRRRVLRGQDHHGTLLRRPDPTPGPRLVACGDGGRR